VLTVERLLRGRNLVDYPSAFEAFWAEYPRRVRKKDALGAWRGALVGAEVIIKAVRAQVAAKMLDSGKRTPHPSTWLNGEQWMDTWRTVYCPRCAATITVTDAGQVDANCPECQEVFFIQREEQ
jgi:hypothetical protein